MSNNDELRTAVGREVCNAMNFPPEVIPHMLGRDLSKAIDAITESIESAGYRKPRTITTAEDLDKLPDGSVILDKEGDCFQRYSGMWEAFETASLNSRKVIKYGPVTALHEAKP